MIQPTATASAYGATWSSWSQPRHSARRSRVSRAGCRCVSAATL